MVSASSWSLIEGMGMRFTMTECPLTAVATRVLLIWLSVNSLAMALETCPESTIIESTTISGASGSRPRWTTSSPSRPLFNSTALMLEEPTSRPTIVLEPNPNMCPPLCVEQAPSPAAFDSLKLPGRFHCRLGFLLALDFHLVGFLFHPLVQLRFLEAPAVPQFESRNALFSYVFVERVRTHSQVLRRLANVHDFSRV